MKLNPWRAGAARDIDREDVAYVLSPRSNFPNVPERSMGYLFPGPIQELPVYRSLNFYRAKSDPSPFVT